ncbi:hypothetical protein B0H14DRAFT_2658732 [Mycena olivaceomarginata]|nr:hypothetical protein B0H14DRAFT_2658732 [Mycena olivaceomarginata]
MFCVAAAHKHGRWAGGGGEGTLGAGSEREKGAAEGGWGLRGCSLGPLHWITAGDPFLSPEYVQISGEEEAERAQYYLSSSQQKWRRRLRTLRWNRGVVAVGSSRRKGTKGRVQIPEQTSSSSIFYEKYRPGGSVGATAIMSYQRVFEGGGVAHEVNRTKQRNSTEIQSYEGCCGRRGADVAREREH